MQPAAYPWQRLTDKLHRLTSGRPAAEVPVFMPDPRDPHSRSRRSPATPGVPLPSRGARAVSPVLGLGRASDAHHCLSRAQERTRDRRAVRVSPPPPKCSSGRGPKAGRGRRQVNASCRSGVARGRRHGSPPSLGQRRGRGCGSLTPSSDSVPAGQGQAVVSNRGRRGRAGVREVQPWGWKGGDEMPSVTSPAEAPSCVAVMRRPSSPGRRR